MDELASGEFLGKKYDIFRKVERRLAISRIFFFQIGNFIFICIVVARRFSLGMFCLCDAKCL